MAFTSSADPNINRVIGFCFEKDNLTKKWLVGGPEVDAEIKAQFGDLVHKARASELKSWAEQPDGALALLLLLDQFPRNIFRSSPLSFSSDSMAVEMAAEAIAKGFDRMVTQLQEPIFYMPFLHDEKLASQVAAVAFYEGLCSRREPGTTTREYAEKGKQFAKRHRDSILRFGRFPARNEALERTSTPEEIQYLKENPRGF